ncbi:hypothetical protein DYB32_010761 [Aphanomyces invadans]|uniref:Tc1-like transposase DDE domain-containing protein n=1 Tax=Aphanomyces invadans TaxID=157072 RepID=A0A3R6V280_9STRA|nr:hypothetical protein DYB32_010761 [Aphanomyces invadans]
MKAFVAADFAGLSISMLTINFSVWFKHVNKFALSWPHAKNDMNKEKWRAFAAKFKKHQQEGDFVANYDETYFNLYCKRSRGRSKRGTCASTVLLPSKGPNLQIQCAVSAELGLVCYRLEGGSIKMDENAAYVETIYQAMKMSASWQDNFAGKRIVIVLDNAPAHSQTEERVVQHDDMTLLRLGPYSPMLNLIESCISVLKSRIKGYLAHHTADMFERGEYRTFLERRKVLLEDAAHESMPCISKSLVIREVLFCQENVKKAHRLENMVYGQ